jgi:crotonobetainyl-CoA:carnitine CoA-transferase CaiB-like acyl-CoA transferase
VTSPPLAGVTVLSLAEQFPGPYATLLLADWGADVVILERPAGGDPARQFPSFHAALNRNKRSIAVDLKTPGGREVARRLATRADVLLEGFRPGVVDRLGVGYDEVRAFNPAIVYVSISGYGQTGPLRDRPGHDISYQAVAGMLQLRSGRPTDPAVPVGDLTAGTFAATAAVLGLFAKQRTGRGTYVDLSMVDCLHSWMTPHLFSRANQLEPPGIPPDEPAYGVFATADRRWITLSIGHEDHFWRRLCHALDMTTYSAISGPERRTRSIELRAMVEDAIAGRTHAEWEPILVEYEIPFASVPTLGEIPAAEHIDARQLLLEGPSTEDGRRLPRKHVRQPLRLRGADTVINREVPRVGEHTREVLTDAGYTGHEVDALIARAEVAEGT